MRPKKVICPICGEEMIAENWGIKREVRNCLGGQMVEAGYPKNYVNYECSCGNKMQYEGFTDCWQKDCKCKCKCKCDSLKRALSWSNADDK